MGAIPEKVSPWGGGEESGGGGQVGEDFEELSLAGWVGLKASQTESTRKQKLAQEAGRRIRFHFTLRSDSEKESGNTKAAIFLPLVVFKQAESIPA